MATIFFKLRQRLKKGFDSARDAIPITLLVTYSFAGAAILRAVDQSLEPELDNNMGLNVDNCLASQTYWGAVYYVNTVYTSIGWGNIYPCTWPCKLLSVFYVLFGIPLVVVVLDQLGAVFTKIVDKGWALAYPWLAKAHKALRDRLKEALKKWKMQVPFFSKRTVVKKEDDGIVVSDTPLSCGMLLTAIWVLLSAIYFQQTEGWRYHDALYFCMIAFTTVGFGDFAPRMKEGGLTIVIFIFLFVGLALVSMQIQLVQENLRKLYKRVQDKLVQEYMQRLAEGEDGNEKEGVDVRKFVSTTWLSKLMSKQQMDELISQSTHLSNMRVRAVQATPLTQEASVDNVPPMSSTGTDSDVMFREQGTSTDPLTEDKAISCNLWRDPGEVVTIPLLPLVERTNFNDLHVQVPLPVPIAPTMVPQRIPAESFTQTPATAAKIAPLLQQPPEQHVHHLSQQAADWQRFYQPHDAPATAPEQLSVTHRSRSFDRTEQRREFQPATHRQPVAPYWYSYVNAHLIHALNTPHMNSPVPLRKAYSNYERGRSPVTVTVRPKQHLSGSTTGSALSLSSDEGEWEPERNPRLLVPQEFVTIITSDDEALPSSAAYEANAKKRPRHVTFDRDRNAHTVVSIPTTSNVSVGTDSPPQRPKVDS